MLIILLTELPNYYFLVPTKSKQRRDSGLSHRYIALSVEEEAWGLGESHSWGRLLLSCLSSKHMIPKMWTTTRPVAITSDMMKTLQGAGPCWDHQHTCRCLPTSLVLEVKGHLPPAASTFSTPETWLRIKFLAFSSDFNNIQPGIWRTSWIFVRPCWWV